MRIRHQLSQVFHSGADEPAIWRNIAVFNLVNFSNFPQVIITYLSRSTPPPGNTRTKRDGGVSIGTVPPS